MTPDEIRIGDIVYPVYMATRVGVVVEIITDTDEAVIQRLSGTRLRAFIRDLRDFEAHVHKLADKLDQHRSTLTQLTGYTNKLIARGVINVAEVPE